MTNLQLEFDRRKGQTTRMLEAFKAKGELTTADLMAIGTGCSSRLKELRREGHRVVAQYEKPGMWRYIYLGHEDDLEG
jgi:hypothetical protein